MTTPADQLTTERLIMRRPQASDLPVYSAYCMSERSKYVGGPYDAQKAFEMYFAMAGHWTIRGFGRYIITWEGRAIGHVGPLQIDDTIPPEFTWTLWDGTCEGQGFATEAARGVQHHLMQDCGWPEMIIRILPDNAKSRKIAEAVGARLTDEPAPAWYEGALTYRLGGHA